MGGVLRAMFLAMDTRGGCRGGHHRVRRRFGKREGLNGLFAGKCTFFVCGASSRGGGGTSYSGRVVLYVGTRAISTTQRG